jgi:type I restriction enzyme, S subunit
MSRGWETKKLGDVATLQRGFDLPIQERVSGNVPLVTSSGVSDTHNRSMVQGPGVATGRSGSIGNVFYIEEDFWPLNTVLYVKDFHGNYPRFVYYLLRDFDLKRFASGTGVPTLNRNFVHDELVKVPSLAEQQRIASLLDEAFIETRRLEDLYRQKQEALRALKRSLLHKAFTGGL